MAPADANPPRPMVLSADRPKQTLEQDRLCYAPFARAIAKAIRLARSPDGLVFAIHGPWGSGKTSAVNMVVDALREGQSAVPGDQPPVIVRFNPWWFSEQQDLTRVFFAELSAALGGKVPPEVVDGLRRVAKHVVRGKDVLLSLLELVPGGNLGKGAVSGVLDALGQGLEDQRTLDEERAALAEALRSNGLRILVIIDDIDRLPPDEARQMFRLVKSVADLPNVIYLMVFDRTIAAEALRNEAAADGPHWLEKIVQASFDLPPVNRLDLRQLFLGQLAEIVGDVDVGDEGRWFNVYMEAVEPWLRTPRDVTRLCNALSVSYPPVADEVDFADFVALESLRLFEPGLYDIVRHSNDELSGFQHEKLYGQPSSIGDRLLSAVPDARQQRIKNALQRLFPRLESVWGNMHYSGDSMRRWDRQRRCCVPRHFGTYFGFGIGEDVLSRQELDAVLVAFRTPAAAEELVRCYVTERRRTGGTKAALLLEELRTTAPDLSREQARPVLTSLLQVADYFLNTDDDGVGVLSLPRVWFVDFTVDALIDRLPSNERAAVLEEALKTAHSLSALSFVVFSMAREHGRHTEDGAKPEDKRRLTEEEVLRLETLLAGQLKAAAENRSLLEMPELLRLMYAWAMLAGDDAVKEWTDDLLKDDAATICLAAAVTGTSKIQSGDDPRVHTAPIVNRQGLSPVLDVDRLTERLYAVEPDADERDRVVIKRFMEGLERNNSRDDF